MSSRLLSLLERLIGHRILCVGDIMLDRYIYGNVDRISPEAPIPVLHIEKEISTLGGAGNVARNISALGGQVYFVGVTGNDYAARDIESQISTLPETKSCLLADSARSTTIKTRYIANGQQLLRADLETVFPLSRDIENRILHLISEAIKNCAIVVLSDYAKGVLTDNVISETIQMARNNNLSVIIDPKGRNFGRYRGAFLLTPNRRELSEATGMPSRTLDEVEKATRHLIESCDLQGVLAKLGGDGVCLVMKDRPPKHFRISPREIYDVSGAGDTVLAVIALALAGNIDPADGAELANIAGSIVVGKIGTAVVTLDELVQELNYSKSRNNDRKIMDLSEAVQAVELWRKQGFKIGFTNGVFDLLHPGHLSLIRQARERCDKLVIGINSDDSVRRLKGKDRPVQSENARAEVLASLADVDAVVIFTEDNPLNVIKGIRPSLLVKGADYTLETVVGADLVKSWNGEVFLADLVDGQSTTATIKKLKP